jgi:hypothetical protein
MRSSLLFALVALSSAACTSNVVGTAPEPVAQPASPPRPSETMTEPAELFGVTGPAAKDDLYGVWARVGDVEGDDVRLLLGKTSIIVARKCASSSVVGIKVSADTKYDSIAVLESGSDERPSDVGDGCEVKLVPAHVERCGRYRTTDCFHTPDGRLVFAGGSLFPNSTWVKVTD